jgi:acyl-CoA synthetase (AMP-forming)/AMP-acid ligase II
MQHTGGAGAAASSRIIKFYVVMCQVLEAAVIGIPHAKWTERPLLVVVPQPGESPTADELRSFLKVTVL